MPYFVIETVAFLLAGCFAASQCPNGTISSENATAIIEHVNQVRRKLADGLQITVNGTLLPPAKNIYDLQWDCELEKRVVDMIAIKCVGGNHSEPFFWFQHFAIDESIFEYLSKEQAKIEDASINVTDEAVVYNDTDPTYGPLGFYYDLYVYMNLMSANARKFACIIVGGTCPMVYSDKQYICATEQAVLETGDIVYEIAPATTGVAATTKATTSVATTAKATTNATTVTSLKSVATSSTPTLPKHITECASAPTTPSCITRSPKRVRREAKASPFEDFLMKKPAPAKRGGKTHRKKTLTAHRTHAAKTATGEN